MNERIRRVGEQQVSPDQDTSEPRPERTEDLEATFFQDLALPLSELEEAHPLGPEARSEEQRKKDRNKASHILEGLRNHPLTRPLFMTVALLLGGELLPGVSGSKELSEKDPIEQTEFEEPGVQQELRRLVFAELARSGHALTEVEGRFGRESWSQEENVEYEDIPTLEGKFEYLHRDNPDIVEAFQDPQGRMENFTVLFNLMTNEFRHSRLPFEFLNRTIDDAVEVLPGLDPTKAMEIYLPFETSIATVGGLKPLKELAKKLLETLPEGHPILAHIDQKKWLTPEAELWFKSSKDNFMLFDQTKGWVSVYRQVGSTVILLENFPGNGGPPDGVAWERGMPAHIAVRTPDGEYTFSRAFEKKSASWQYSWVTDTAPLRWTADKSEVEYQDTDGRWRRLTGEDAEFAVYGAVQKPFRKKGKSGLYQAASQRQEDGTWRRPQPFSVEDVLGPDGDLRSTWDSNDFGPKAIQIKDENDQVMSIFFHSSPTDEASQEYLDFSHGCIHMKPGDLEAVSHYLDRGSLVRISSVRKDVVSEHETVTQIEKPGSDQSAG